MRQRDGLGLARAQIEHMLHGPPDWEAETAGLPRLRDSSRRHSLWEQTQFSLRLQP